MTSRAASSTGPAALDRPAAAQANANAQTNRSSAGGTGNAPDFQALLAGRLNANPPAVNAARAASESSGTEDAGSSRQSGRGQSRDTEKRKALDPADAVSDCRAASSGAAQALAGAGIAPGAATAAAGFGTLSSPPGSSASHGPEDASHSAGSAASATEPTVSAAVSAASTTASAASPHSGAPPGSGASAGPLSYAPQDEHPQADARAAPQTAGKPNSTGESAAADASPSLASADCAANASHSPAPADTRGSPSTSEAQRGTAAPERSADSALPARNSQDANCGTTSSSDPQQQLLAWLSGAAGLQPGTPRSTGGGLSGEASASRSPEAAEPLASGPIGAGAVAAAIAPVLAWSAGGIQTTSSTTASPVSGQSPDAAHTDSPSSDPSQNVNALLFGNAVPIHLAAAAHTGAAHAGAGHAGAAQQSSGTLQAPLGTSAWVEELGAQLTWMANRGIESASLHVSPAELGPIEVRIAVHGSDASVWFGAAQAATRTALEQSLPQLRQLLASNGLALADAGVFREPPRGSARQVPSRSIQPVGAVSEETSRTVDTRTAARLGLLDLYA